MSFEITLRALGHLACVFAFGLIIASTSMAALNVASQNNGVVCSDRHCMETVRLNDRLGTQGSPMHRIVAFLDG